MNREYVQHWFDHTALNRATPTRWELARRSIEEASDAHEGFAPLLRQIALEALGSLDASIVRRALVVLASVGTSADLATLEGVADSSDAGIAGEARATIFELTHRAV